MAEKLYSGAAKIKITPSEELMPFMFGLMGRKYGKVRDDLYLRVLYLCSGEKKAMIVVFDLDKATDPEEWTALLQEKTGVPAENIVYTAIHTHTAPLTGYRPFEGPNFIGRKPPEIQEKVKVYEAFLKDCLLKAAEEAVRNARPASFGFGKSTCDIGANRVVRYDIRNEDGTEDSTLGLGYNAEGTVDHTQMVLRIDDRETGNPIAFLSNYAVHCVAGYLNNCGNDESFLSADIAGEVSRALEEAYPGSVALWTSAPAGDINPVNMVQTFHPDLKTGAPVERCLEGEDVGDGIITAMAGRQLSAIRRALKNIPSMTDEAEIYTAVDYAKTRCKKGGFEGTVPECDEDYVIRTHLLQIGSLALIGIDGELYTSHGLAMKAASPLKDTFLINHDSSLLLNNPGYIIDDDTIKKLVDCKGHGSGRGGIPGGSTYTEPGSVKRALIESTERLFKKKA